MMFCAPPGGRGDLHPSLASSSTLRTPPICIAIGLQFVLQYFWCPYAPMKGKYCQYSSQYASYLYRSAFGKILVVVVTGMFPNKYLRHDGRRTIISEVSFGVGFFQSHDSHEIMVFGLFRGLRLLLSGLLDYFRFSYTSFIINTIAARVAKSCPSLCTSSPNNSSKVRVRLGMCTPR